MSKSKQKEKVVSRKFVARREREKKQTALIRNISLGIVAVVILLLGFGYLDQTVLQKQRPVATVNGEKISIAQFQGRVRLERENLINQYLQYKQMAEIYQMDLTSQTQPIEERLSQPLTIGSDAITTMTNELIYKQEAANYGIEVTEADVEKEIQAFLNYFPDGTPTAMPTSTPVSFETATLSPEQLALVTITPTATEAPTSTPAAIATPTEAVEETPTEEGDTSPTAVPVPTLTATPYTLEGYQQAYTETLPLYEKFGVNEADFRFLFESRLYYTKLYDEITKDTPREDEYIWARHILLDDASAAAIVRERLLAGEDFGTVAQEASIDPSVATNKGDLGWFTKDMMVKPFSDAAFALKIGEISDVVKTDFGYHVIQLLGRETRPLDETAYQRARDKVFQEWLAATREDYDIEVFDDVWQSEVPTDPDLQQTLAELHGAHQ